MKFRDIPKFIHGGNYQINVSWVHIEEHLAHWSEGERASGKVNLEPDFQRAHVWTRKQQIAYIEYGLRGGVSGRELHFNCPGWMNDFRGPFELVDGLQRLTAVRKFIANEIPAFGCLFNSYEDKMSIMEPNFLVRVNNLETRAKVLQWYLDMNSGGTVHSPKDLDKVRAMLAEEQAKGK